MTLQKVQEYSPPNIKIAVVLPAYNEALTIKATLEEFHKALPTANLYVIDNNSTDESGKIAKDTLVTLGNCGKVFFEPWQGKGNAIRRAFYEIDADIYLMVDADATYPAEQCHELIAPVVRGEADMVVGDRLSDGDYNRENNRPFHNFGNHLVVNLVSFVGKLKFNDVMSGYRAMNRTFVRNYPLTVPGFQLETDLSLFAAINRYRVKEVPIRYKNRPEGSASKLDTYRDGFRVLATVINCFRHYKPLIFFTLLAFISALLALFVGVPSLYAYIEHHAIPSLFSTILALCLVILTFVFLGTGLIVDSLAFFYRNLSFIERNKRERESLSKADYGFKD